MKKKEENRVINAEYAEAVSASKSLKSAIRDYTANVLTDKKALRTVSVLLGIDTSSINTEPALLACVSVNAVKKVILTNYPYIGYDAERSVVYLTVKRAYFAQTLEHVETVYTFAEVTDYKKVIKLTAKNMLQNYVDTCNGKKVPAPINTIKVNMTNRYYKDSQLSTVFDTTDHKQVMKDKDGNWVFVTK